MSLLTNLVSYYKFDGNSNDIQGSHNGTDTSVSYVTGKINSAASFNGSTSYSYVNPTTDFQFGSGDFTLALWIKRANVNVRYAMFCQVDAGGTDLSINFEITATNFLRLNYRISGTTTLEESTALINDTNWHHVGVTRSGSTLKFYKDGTLQYSASISGSIQVQTPKFAIGKAGEVAALYFNGLIDEFGVWKGRSLTDAEFLKLYNGGSGFPYPFIENSSNFFLMF